ncbi:MAG: ribosome biogenesis GTP-binding protein YihA/YsxC [Pseudomonadota bacterium]
MTWYPDAEFVKSAYKPPQFVPDEGVEVAFAGRSNAGKSSAVNTIVGRRQFARTSKTPGRTQLINFFALSDQLRLVDLPGYGFARVDKKTQDHWRTLMNRYFTERQSLVGLVLVVDIRRGLTDFDRAMLELADLPAAAVHILLTKADKLKREPARRVLRAVRDELGPNVGLQLFSALKSTGVDEARRALDALLRPPVQSVSSDA